MRKIAAAVPLLLAVALSALVTAPGWARQQPTPPPPSPTPVRSPEVGDGGRVTFRLRAPNAKQVLLARDGAARVPMAKSPDGVWTVTTEPLAPDLYTYTFVVDGVPRTDPANPDVKPAVAGGGKGLVLVPAAQPQLWEVDPAAPRGTLQRHAYASKVIGDDREFYVYTPPGYDPTGARTYPVLYLLHGLGDDARAWTTAGRANVILDNLIARGTAKPMIVVNTLGYGLPDPAGNPGALFAPENQQKSRDQFRDALVTEVLPRVEKAYRVAEGGAASRALAGLSMGGAQALWIGLNDPARFGWVGSFSGAFVMLDASPERAFPALARAKAAAQPKSPDVDPPPAPPRKLLWIACGTDDSLIGANRSMRDWLKGKGVTMTYLESPGAHSWTVWRHNLADFAPLLFR